MLVKNVSNSNLFLRGITSDVLAIQKGDQVAFSNTQLVKGYEKVLKVFEGVVEYNLGVEKLDTKPTEPKNEEKKEERNPVDTTPKVEDTKESKTPKKQPKTK